jgi:hypothetical protein
MCTLTSNVAKTRNETFTVGSVYRTSLLHEFIVNKHYYYYHYLLYAGYSHLYT